MQITETPLAGLLLIEPKIFSDHRGHFLELYQKSRFTDWHIPEFVQDNVSRSKQHVLRGLHYQSPKAQGKLVGVLRGVVWDVVVDIRISSPTFGQWFGLILSADNYTQLYIPPGFAHGFVVLSEEADFFYKCTDFYSPQAELGIAWNDPTLNIPWPCKNPILSPKDECLPVLNEINHEQLFA